MYKDKSGLNTSTETSDQPVHSFQLFMTTLMTDSTSYVGKRVTVRPIKSFGTILTATSGSIIQLISQGAIQWLL